MDSGKLTLRFSVAIIWILVIVNIFVISNKSKMPSKPKEMREFTITVIGSEGYKGFKLTGEMVSRGESLYYEIRADGYSYLFPKAITVVTFKHN